MSFESGNEIWETSNLFKLSLSFASGGRVRYTRIKRDEEGFNNDQ